MDARPSTPNIIEPFNRHQTYDRRVRVGSVMDSTRDFGPCDLGSIPRGRMFELRL